MKKALFLAALVSFAAIFTSCNKEEEIVNVKFKTEGTIKFIVRGYSIGTTGTSPIPDAIKNGNSVAVSGYQIVLTDGTSYTTDAQGYASITLPAGTYHYKAVKPAGYYWMTDLDVDYEYGMGGIVYTYKLKPTPSSADDLFGDSFTITSGTYHEEIVQLIK